MQHSLDIIIDQTHTKWVTAVVILLVIVILGTTLVFQLPTVKLVAMGVTTAFKLVISFKVLYIVIGKSEQICCSPNSDPDNCPFWISKVLWIIAVFLATIRIAAARHFLDYGWCDRKVKAGYKLVPEAEDSRDEAEGGEEEEKQGSKPIPDSSDDEQTTKKVSSKRSTLKSIRIGRPPRFTFTRRSASVKWMFAHRRGPQSDGQRAAAPAAAASSLSPCAATAASTSVAPMKFVTGGQIEMHLDLQPEPDTTRIRAEGR
jgi:hypothetical protein